MDALAIHASTLLDWLLRTTGQASLLICLVLLAQRLLRRQLGVRARYLLWLVVVARMALPWAPQSGLSVYNLVPGASMQRYEALMGPVAEAGPAYFAGSGGIGAAKPFDRGDLVAHYPAGTAADMRANRLMGRGSTGRIIACLGLFWLTGACFLAVWILVRNVRILRVVRRVRPVTDPEILDLLDDCRRQMGTRRRVRVIATDRVHGPALFGLVRPRLLLPSSILVDMDRGELRYILLHELAHLRRHDILIDAIASALHVLHWFNPLIGYGFQRMRADRELACDGLALSRLHPNETSAYGHTVLRLIEQLAGLRLYLVPAGFLGGRARITQRVAMISRFTKQTYRYTPAAVGLLVVLVCIGLTNGRTLDRIAQGRPEAGRQAESNALPQASATTYEYRNIWRIYIYHLETAQYLIAAGNSVDYGPEPGTAGLWEAHFNGKHDRDVLLYSVSEGKYLRTDEQGNLKLSQLGPDAWAYWIMDSNPLGVYVISHAFEYGYLGINEKGEAKVALFGRDQGRWEIVQLDRDKDIKEDMNK
jgi:beta-lactamase regulating signal transducer with metallopeptidase domain